MIAMTADEAKNRFGKLLSTAQREPVTIVKRGKGVAVVVSQEEYTRLQAVANAYWALRADLALLDTDWLSAEDSEALLKVLIENAQM